MDTPAPDKLFKKATNMVLFRREIAKNLCILESYTKINSATLPVTSRGEPPTPGASSLSEPEAVPASMILTWCASGNEFSPSLAAAGSESLRLGEGGD
jgi:hypothetical protein